MSTEAQTAEPISATESTPPPTPEPTATTPAATPKDNAQVSGKVKPASTKKQAAKTPVRTPAQVEYDDAKAAHELTGKTLEAARLKLEAANRQVHFLAGQKAVHAVLLRAETENRESTLGAFLDAAQGDEKQAILDYISACDTEAALLKKVLEKTAPEQ